VNDSVRYYVKVEKKVKEEEKVQAFKERSDL
jgi:hypothetical protein